jgi:hypothetical protein
VLTTTISSGLQGVADARQLGLHIGGGDHVAVGEVAEVQLHPGLEAPVQRHLVDGDRALLVAQRLVHRAVEVVRRVQVRAVVGGQLHQLHRPAFAVGQVLLLQAGEEGRDLLEGVGSWWKYWIFGAKAGGSETTSFSR